MSYDREYGSFSEVFKDERRPLFLCQICSTPDPFKVQKGFLILNETFLVGDQV